MDSESVHDKLLYASYCPPQDYEEYTSGEQPVVTALFRETTEDGGLGYAIREYSLRKGGDVLSFSQAGRALEPGDYSRGVVQGDRGALAARRL